MALLALLVWAIVIVCVGVFAIGVSGAAVLWWRDVKSGAAWRQVVRDSGTKAWT